MNWKYLFSWPSLAIEAALLCVITWPWAGHWVSIFWAIITLAVLLGELLNYLFSPKKQTVSNNIQDELKEDPWRFWLMQAVWIGFALTLFGHFCLKGM